MELTNYPKLLKDVRTAIITARTRAIKVINRELIQLYWEIGELIVQRQEQEGWGKSVVEKLSKDLCVEIPDSKGYSTQNLWYMRQFYLTYKENLNLQQLVGEIPWGHNILIFSKLKDDAEREYYLKASASYGWSRNVLGLKIKSQDYQRSIIGNASSNFEIALPEELVEQTTEAIKSSYNLEFLGLNQKASEREIEVGLIAKLRDFLIELGYGFAFLGSQYKLKLGEKDYFLDLLFFHRKLNCLVVFELKAGAFKPEYAGKLNFYLEVINDTIKEPHENPAIGILLCQDKDDLDVEYSLRSVKNPIGVSQYQLQSELPKELLEKLPSSKELNDFIRTEKE